MSTMLIGVSKCSSHLPICVCRKLYEDEFKREAGDGDDEGTRSSSETRGISHSPQVR